VRAVPCVWVRQVRVGGLILVDVKPRAVAGNLVLLHRYADRAEGPFDARAVKHGRNGSNSRDSEFSSADSASTQTVNQHGGRP
jgi:hypothetical protein